MIGYLVIFAVQVRPWSRDRSTGTSTMAYGQVRERAAQGRHAVADLVA